MSKYPYERGAPVWCPWQASPSVCGSIQGVVAMWPVAYRLQLPDILSAVHNVFHVSQLKKCLRILEEAVEIEELPL